MSAKVLANRKYGVTKKGALYKRAFLNMTS